MQPITVIPDEAFASITDLESLTAAVKIIEWCDTENMNEAQLQRYYALLDRIEEADERITAEIMARQQM